MTTKNIYNNLTQQLQSTLVLEDYQYPLNLAIAYRCSSDVLERLVTAAPQVLSILDGKSQSLHILMRHKPQDTVSLDMMLLKNAEITCWKDTKENSALHIAVSHGAGLESVRYLAVTNPEPLSQRNFHGETPLDLAQRHYNICSEEVVNYLLIRQARPLSTK